jgi:hypothetical protein
MLVLLEGKDVILALELELVELTVTLLALPEAFKGKPRVLVVINKGSPHLKSKTHKLVSK